MLFSSLFHTDIIIFTHYTVHYTYTGHFRTCTQIMQQLKGFTGNEAAEPFPLYKFFDSISFYFHSFTLLHALAHDSRMEMIFFITKSTNIYMSFL